MHEIPKDKWRLGSMQCREKCAFFFPSSGSEMDEGGIGGCHIILRALVIMRHLHEASSCRAGNVCVSFFFPAVGDSTREPLDEFG